MKIFLLGCGFVGKKLAQNLCGIGHEVVGWVRSNDSALELRGLGVSPLIGDFTEAAAWGALPHDFDLAIHIASSGRGDVAVYEKVYLEGMRRLAAHLPKARLFFVSSTSVYGQIDGAIVDESSETNPSTATSQVLLKAEQIALEKGGIVVRPSGIYGPQRSVLFQKFMEGTAVIEGEGDRWVNQIHRDDVAGGITFLIENNHRSGIFNLTDQRPSNHMEIYQWLAQKTGKPLPPYAAENHQRKRGWTHKRISSQKLQTLGWRLKFPTFEEGYSSFLGAQSVGGR